MHTINGTFFIIVITLEIISNGKQKWNVYLFFFELDHLYVGKKDKMSPFKKIFLLDNY